jgi:hypothetical protein
MRLRKLLVSGAVIAAAAGGVAMTAGAASATTTFTATTAMQNWPDCGHSLTGGCYWQTGNGTRTATLTDNGVDSDNSSLEDYTLVINDADWSWTTNSGVSDPAGLQSAVIANGPISGWETGTITESFTEPTSILPNSGGVPPTDSNRSVPTSAWASLFFGGHAESNPVETYSYEYYSPQTCETWIDSNTDNDGQQEPAAGDITGYGHCDVSITNPGTQTTHAGSNASLQIFASTGSSSPALSYSAVGLPGSLTINSATGQISGNAGSTVENTDIVKVTVTDSYGASAHVFFAWDVVPATVNVPDVVTDSYVCGHSSPRAQFRLTVPTGTYTVQVRMTEVRKGGAVVGDGTIFVHPGRSYIINANDSVALRIYYQANGSSGPVIFKFARVPALLSNQRNC